MVISNFPVAPVLSTAAITHNTLSSAIWTISHGVHLAVYEVWLKWLREVVKLPSTLFRRPTTLMSFDINPSFWPEQFLESWTFVIRRWSSSVIFLEEMSTWKDLITEGWTSVISMTVVISPITEMHLIAWTLNTRLQFVVKSFLFHVVLLSSLMPSEFDEFNFTLQSSSNVGHYCDMLISFFCLFWLLNICKVGF